MADAGSSPPRKTNNKLLGMLDCIGGALPFLVLFIIVPFSIYLPNQDHFDNSIIVLVPMLLAGVIGIGVMCLLGRMKSPVSGAICKWLFWIGACLLINDMITPVGISKLDGRNIAANIQIPSFYIYIQVFVLVLCLLVAWFTNWAKIKRIAGTFVAAMLVLQLTTFALEVSPETIWSLRPGTKPFKTYAAPAQPSVKNNVYHIILDGFSSQTFIEMMNNNRLNGLFNGFVFYKNTRSNGLVTNQSVPGIMTGSFMPEKKKDQSLKQWWYESVSDWSIICKSKGILSKAYEDGYAVSQYIPRLYMWPYEKATRLYLGSQLAKEGGLVPSFADLWLLRLAPVPIKKQLFDKDDKGPFSRAFGVKVHFRHWAHWSIGLGKILLDDEKSRSAAGNYVFAHLMLPHYPYVVNAECEYIGAQRLRDEHYLAQANCGLKMVKALLDQLKQAGKFKDSLIIVHADHGEHAVGPLDAFNQMPKDFFKQYDDDNHVAETAKYINNRSLALLLIKLPGVDEEPLSMDNRLVSLVDLEPTICDVMGWPQTSPHGRSLLQNDGQDRRVDIFCKLNYPNIIDTRPSLIHVIFDGKHWRINNDYPEDMHLNAKRELAGHPSADSVVR